MLTPQTINLPDFSMQIHTGFETAGVWIDLNSDLGYVEMKDGKPKVVRINLKPDYSLGAPFTIGQRNPRGEIPLIVVRGVLVIDSRSGEGKWLKGNMKNSGQMNFDFVYFNPDDENEVFGSVDVDFIYRTGPNDKFPKPYFSILEYEKGFKSQTNIYFLKTRNDTQGEPMYGATDRWVTTDLRLKEVTHPLAIRLTQLRDSLPNIQKLMVSDIGNTALFQHPLLPTVNTSAYFVAWNDSQSRIQPLFVNGFGISTQSSMALAPDGKHIGIVQSHSSMSHDVFIGRIIPTDSLPQIELKWFHHIDEAGNFECAFMGDSKTFAVLQSADDSKLLTWTLEDTLFTLPRRAYSPPEI